MASHMHTYRRQVRGAPMTRIPSLTLILTAASAISFAQTGATGGWRRVTDPAPGQQPAQTQSGQPNGEWRRFEPPPPAIDQDPTQPVARADEYGQPQQPPVQQRTDRPA